MLRRKLLRVLAYFTVVTTVATVFGLRHARAEFTNKTLELGRQMAELAMTKNHEITGIVFNGQLMHVGSTVSDATPEAVLKHYEDYCQAKTSAFLGEGATPPSDKLADGVRDGFFRMHGNDGDEGAVICFVKGPDAKPTRKEAAAAFSKTGALGAIGELRYAYAKKGESGRTLVLTAWTDSKFNLLQIMPPTPNEDVGGVDIPNVPRVPGSIRVVSARAEGLPYAANVYKTSDSPEKVVAYYDGTMRERGWLILDPELSPEDHGPAGARGFVKDGVVVTLAANKDTDATYVALGISGVGAEQPKVGVRPGR